MYYLKLEHMVCFDAEELKRLYSDEGREEIKKMVDKCGYTLKEIVIDIRKRKEVIDIINKKNLGDTTTTEILAVLYCLLGFYANESKVCFVLKNNFDPIKTVIRSFTHLKMAIRQDQEIDFGILSKKILRTFQFKRYTGSAETEELLKFLKDKLGHYGFNLGHTNLLVILQCPGANLDQIDFVILEQELKNFLTQEGEVLITFNAENKFSVIKRIYPGAGIAKIPFILPSRQR